MAGHRVRRAPHLRLHILRGEAQQQRAVGPAAVQPRALPSAQAAEPNGHKRLHSCIRCLCLHPTTLARRSMWMRCGWATCGASGSWRLPVRGGTFRGWTAGRAQLCTLQWITAAWRPPSSWWVLDGCCIGGGGIAGCCMQAACVGSGVGCRRWHRLLVSPALTSSALSTHAATPPAWHQPATSADRAAGGGGEPAGLRAWVDPPHALRPHGTLQACPLPAGAGGCPLGSCSKHLLFCSLSCLATCLPTAWLTCASAALSHTCHLPAMPAALPSCPCLPVRRCLSICCSRGQTPPSKASPRPLLAHQLRQPAVAPQQLLPRSGRHLGMRLLQLLHGQPIPIHRSVELRAGLGGRLGHHLQEAGRLAGRQAGI